LHRPLVDLLLLLSSRVPNSSLRPLESNAASCARVHHALPDVLPEGFHLISHDGLLPSADRNKNIAMVRALLEVTPPAVDQQKQADLAPDAPRVLPCRCPRRGDRMIVIEVFARLRAKLAAHAKRVEP
jgi:hypothetical protein